MALGTRRLPCSLNDLHGLSHAKGLCFSCYEKKRRGTLDEAKERALGKPGDIQISIPEALEKKGVSARARYVIEQYVFNPKRVAALVQHFYERALKNDKVLIEYIKVLTPNRDVSSPVQVIINAPTISREEKVVYDVTGEAVDVPKVRSKADLDRAPAEDVHPL